jgi:hypothetical protein
MVTPLSVANQRLKLQNRPRIFNRKLWKVQHVHINANYEETKGSQLVLLTLSKDAEKRARRTRKRSSGSRDPLPKVACRKMKTATEERLGRAVGRSVGRLASARLGLARLDSAWLGSARACCARMGSIWHGFGRTLVPECCALKATVQCEWARH